MISSEISLSGKRLWGVCILLTSLMILACIPEFAIARNPPEVNVALASNGATITADSEWRSSPYDQGGVTPASRLIDGIIRCTNYPPELNRWHAGVNAPHPHWVWVRFARPARINRMVLWRSDFVGAPLDFVGEYLPPHGGACRILFHVTNARLDSNRQSVTVNFRPVVSDNFRLFITKSSSAQFPDYCQATELQVFGRWVGQPTKRSKTQPRRHIVIQLRNASLPAGLSEKETTTDIVFTSLWLKVAFPLNRAGVSFLCVDQNGSGRLDQNLLKPPGGADMVAESWNELVSDNRISFHVYQRGNIVRYTDISMGNLEKDDLTFMVEPKSLKIVIDRRVPSSYLSLDTSPLRMLFDASVISPIPMGRIDKPGEIEFPLLLHFPNYGSLEIHEEGESSYLRCTDLRSKGEDEYEILTGCRANRDATTTQMAGHFRNIITMTVSDQYPRNNQWWMKIRD